MTAIPKENHPWRQYKNKLPANGHSETVAQKKALRIFLEEIVLNWSNFSVPTRFRGHFDRYYLMELPDHLVAGYLIGLLKRYTNGNYQPEEEYEKEVFDEAGAGENY